MQEFWNNRYESQEYSYGTQPNKFLEECIQKYRPATLLLPAEGEGRNAVYAAGKGIAVTAFDFSEMGRQKASRLAAERKVKINYSIMDLNNYRFNGIFYDMVGLIFIHLPPSDRRAFHKEVSKTLRPGGHLILEAFTPVQLKNSSGGPSDLERLYTSAALKEDFADLKISYIEELTIDLDEGIFHRGTASVIRLIAEKE